MKIQPDRDAGNGRDRGPIHGQWRFGVGGRSSLARGKPHCAEALLREVLGILWCEASRPSFPLARDDREHPVAYLSSRCAARACRNLTAPLPVLRFTPDQLGSSCGERGAGTLSPHPGLFTDNRQ